MTYIDPEIGAAKIRDLCEEQGLSPEALAKAICARAERQDNWFATLGGVDGSTIRRMLGNPAKGRPAEVPGIRVRAAVARYFGLTPREIWQPAAMSAPAYRELVAA